MIGYKMLSAVALAAVTVAAVGCQREPRFEDVRPPVGQVDPRGRGLQAHDVMSATDQLAMDLLARPEISQSDERLTIVLTDMENRTSDPRLDYDIFIERLRGNLSQHGRGSVALIENRARLRDLQRRELEQERDDFGQGGVPIDPGPAGIQPDFALYGRVMEMPGRGTSYYNVQFNLTDLRSREQIWTGQYEVQARR